MGKKINHLWPFIFLLASSCTSVCKQEAVPCSRLLIFLDKSVSVKGQDARLEARVENALIPILESKISNTNDYIEVHLIHGESIGAKALLQKTWKETPPCEATMGPDTYKQEEQDYNNRLKKFRREIKSELLGQLNQKVVGDIVYETDMLGTLAGL